MDKYGREGAGKNSGRAKGIAPGVMASKMSPVTLPPVSDLPSTKCCASVHPPSDVAIFSICASSIWESVSRKDFAWVWCERNESSAIRQYGCFDDLEMSLTEYSGPLPRKMSSRSASGK